MNIEVLKEPFENVTHTELFYKYKNIRMYRLVKGGNYLTFWISVLILDETKEFYEGKWIPCLNVRTLPGYNEHEIDIITLVKEPNKIIPKLFRLAEKENLITEDMFIPWDESTADLIDEI